MPGLGMLIGRPLAFLPPPSATEVQSGDSAKTCGSPQDQPKTLIVGHPRTSAHWQLQPARVLVCPTVLGASWGTPRMNQFICFVLIVGRP